MAYKIFTDSSANLTDALIDAHGIEVVSLTYLVEDQQFISYRKGENNDLAPFYTMLRQKKKVTTSCVNEETFYEAFKAALENGEDVLYVGFSSALSLTFQSGENAVKRLAAEYPSRKVYAVDTLAASMGEGKLVILAAEQKANGKTIDEVRDFVETNKLKLCHWFTVDDLFFLFRGGRVSRMSYYIGSLIKIKPVMHVDNHGKLVPIGKVMGRKKALMTLVDHVCKSIVDPASQTIYISHGDCMDDVKFVQEQIQERVSVKGFVVNYVDPVVGAHSGPGTLAIFHLGEKR